MVVTASIEFHCFPRSLCMYVCVHTVGVCVCKKILKNGDSY